MRLEEVGRIADDEFVVVFAPRNREVREFIRRCRAAPAPVHQRPAPAARAVPPAEPVPPVVVADRFAVKPRLEALAIFKGERICANEDLIRNTAYSWSPMSSDDIRDKTGIEARIYSERDLDELALLAARRAIEGAGREPEEFAAVVFCSCTSTRLIPSVATWMSGQLGIFQTHVSFDLVAACAGFPYGIGEAVKAAPGDQAPGPRRLRGEVLRQDRQRAAVAHDLRRRGGRDGHRPGARGRCG